MKRIQGVMKRIGRKTAFSILFVSLFIAALPVSPIGLFLMVLFALVVGSIHKWWLVYVYIVTTSVFVGFEFFQILHLVTTRHYTVGETVLLLSSLLILYAILCFVLFSTDD